MNAEEVFLSYREVTQTLIYAVVIHNISSLGIKLKTDV